MNTVITFTPAQLVAFIGAVCTFIATIGGAVVIIAKLITKIRKPEIEQNKKIEELEHKYNSLDEKYKELDSRLSDGDDHFSELEKTNKVILRSLQALLNLSLGVNDAEALKEVAKELNDYLLNK